MSILEKFDQFTPNFFDAIGEIMEDAAFRVEIDNNMALKNFAIYLLQEDAAFRVKIDNNIALKNFAIYLLQRVPDRQLVNRFQHVPGLLSPDELKVVQYVLSYRYPDKKQHNDIILKYWETHVSPISEAKSFFR